MRRFLRFTTILGGGSPGGVNPMSFVVTNPATSDRNVIQPTNGAAVPLTIKGAAGQSADLFEVQNSAGAVLSKIVANGEFFSPLVWAGVFPADVVASRGQSNSVALNCMTNGPVGANLANFFSRVDAGKFASNEFDFYAYNPAAPVTSHFFHFIYQSGIYDDAGAASAPFLGFFEADSSAGFQVSDGAVSLLGAGALAWLEGNSTGGVRRIGFFGATPAVKQAGASAAGIAAIIDVNAKAAISALQTALANLGLVTAPA